ncbi:FAD-binding domain-containing protein [Lentithecium fluviatile CBS 122367]|uniref:FAD-binding domain-containing protein n=1 Tax=Lentithecium fluviatile CBS 122367 TaxID=1168545 RepID=A0A6G1JB09_9PLEO|nr:FAD-binding domain-containing protein [Lentithecium fluviatile CBS 122367]
MSIYRVIIFSAVATVASASHAYKGTFGAFASDPSNICSLLKAAHADNTFLPDDAGFVNETQKSWSAQAWLTPACVFAPSDATQLSFAVKTLARSSTPFAMRGGGHMPIADAANIDSTGVLISSTNLNTLQLSDDKETMSIGPGPRWGNVFEYMDGTNLTIVGGRLAPVGVPGLLLGGGISYYSYKHGIGSAGGKIKAYEAVLADSTIATVTSDNEYADLYWALQGGGNSFALITRFDLQTFYAGTPLIADATYGTSNATGDAYLAAVLDFALHGDQDTAGAVTPVARWGPNFTAPSYECTLFYNGSIAPTGGPFTKFFDETTLKSVNGSSTLAPQTLAENAKRLFPAFETGGPGHGLRQKFRVVPTAATAEALKIVHDTYFTSLQASGMADRIPGFFTGLASNAITKTFAEASAGTPQNIPLEPAFWIEESLSWEDASDDAEIEEWLSAVNAEIEEKLEAANATNRYIYLNDADKPQDVFAGYGEENLLKLRMIRSKYDPARVFTDLMPGGFKVDP